MYVLTKYNILFYYYFNEQRRKECTKHEAAHPKGCDRLFLFQKRGEDMEKVKAVEPSIEVFENDIDLYLQEFADRDGIEDFCQVPQSIWNSALRYVYNHVFKPNPNVLKSHVNINIPGNDIPSNCNAYNYELVNEVCDYYIYNMCMRYNKEVSILGFITLTGIDESTVYDWGNSNNKLSSSGFKIYKKLSQMREESLSNKLADGKQNPVGVIAMLNRHYGWASPYTADANRHKQSLTAQELPKLGQNAQPVVQIAQRENSD